MTLEEIKHALKTGLKVYWASDNYQVIKDNIGQYFQEMHITKNIVDSSSTKKTGDFNYIYKR